MFIIVYRLPNQVLRRTGNDTDLLHGLLKGDEISFREIYDRYWYRLFLSSYQRIKDKAVAEELVQDLFLKLWLKRDTLYIDQLENYLFSSIRNATIDHIKRQTVANKYLAYQEVYRSIASNSTEETVALNDLEEKLERGLKTLSGKSEKIFRLYRMDDWSIEKIAAHFNLSQKTVHYHISRSQKLIRTYLQQFTLLIIVLIGRP